MIGETTQGDGRWARWRESASERHRDQPSLARTILAGAASGLVGSWLMEQAQRRLSALGSEETRRREADAQEGWEPATYRAAELAARTFGRTLDDDRKAAAGEVVHLLTGAIAGGVFGAAAHALGARGVLPGLVFGAVLWLVNDEVVVPTLGLSQPPARYPASTHAKALAAHLVYGAAAGSGLRLLAR
jgi:hypothetical protein